MMHRRGWWLGFCVALVGGYAGSPAAQAKEATGKSSSGSFQPPINLVDNDVRYASGAGLAVFAGPLKIFGAVAGAGLPFGESPHPRWGFEAQVAVLKGGGDLDRAGLTGLAPRSMSLAMATGSFVLKMRALSPGEDSIVGLTLYGGATLGYLQYGMTNDFGSAYRNLLSVGASLGALAQLIPHRRVELMAFLGGRALGMLSVPEGGDPDAQSMGTALATPEFGGNITVHLPYDLDVNLGSMLNFMKDDEDERQSAKIFYLGLTWRSDAGFAPIVEGPTS